MQPTLSRPAPGRRHDILAILLAVESFDFPDVGLDTGVLKFVNRLDHQRGTQLKVVYFLVAAEGL